MTIFAKKRHTNKYDRKLVTRIIYLVAAAPFVALVALSLSISQPKTPAQNAPLQQAGAAANGYQKPGAAVRMYFTLPTDLQPGDTGVVHTTWLVDEPVARMELTINGDSGLGITAAERITIDQPTVGFEYTLDIPFTAKSGLHTLGFVSTTSSENGRQSRSFGIAIEAGDSAATQRKANTLGNATNGENLHRMAAAQL